jgi:hypothetical protein
VRICDIRRAGGGIQDGATSEQESQRYHRGDRHALKAIRPTTAGIVGSHGAGSDRNLRRGAIATLALGYRTRHRGPQLRQSWTVHRNGFGEEDQLRRKGIGFGSQQDDLRAWGYSSDLCGDRWIVIQGKLLVEDEEVRSQLLDLQEDVGHRGSLTDHEEAALLEQEPGEPAFQRSSIGDDDRPTGTMHPHA